MRKKFALTILPILLLVGCGSNTTTESPVISDDSHTSDTTPAEEIDYAGQTHLKLDAALFEKVMQNKGDGTFDGTNYCDFNVDGVEKMLTDSDYPAGCSSKVFTNYTDGDTTSFTSYNGFYTVKVRYLAIDTPESTSEIEEWGKTASIFNKSKLSNAKHIIVQSAGCARTGHEAVADIDGYQRTLAYVWYTDVEDPTQNDFRNLNLELVQEGLALFSGSRSDMVEYDDDGNEKDSSFYMAFFNANDQAKSLKKNMYSGKKDSHYWYDSPKKLGLDELYDTSLYTNTTTYKNTTVNYSVYCDEYTKWTFEGVVSRKLGNSFFLQDTINGKTYGLYVFTLRTYAPVQVGNRLRVSGVLSYYSGIYELSGVSYSAFDHQEGDIEYVRDDNGNKVTEEVTPIKATAAEIKSGKYENVLVELDESGTDNSLYFGTTWSTYNGETTSYAYGGLEELNTYNTTHPYYNTSNDIILFGKWGSKMSNVSSFSTLSGDNNYLRVKISSNLRLSDSDDNVITSYQYFTGTYDENGKDRPLYYVPKNPDLAYSLINGTTKYDELDEDVKSTVEIKNYKTKKVTSPIGIAQKYVSSSGNSMYSLSICTADDFSQIAEVE